jgi:phage baseplate assembly protein V
MMDEIRREIRRHLVQARSAFRAVSTGLKIATRIQRAEADGLANEKLQDVELFQHFGFSSAPPDGTQLIVVPLGGRTSASVIVASEHGAYRFKLGANGEAAMYNQWGDVVHMRQDRKIHMVAAVEVLIDAPVLQVNGEIRSTGDITSDSDIKAAGDVVDQAVSTPKSMSGMRTVYDGHNHNDPQGGAVSVPNQLMN